MRRAAAIVALAMLAGCAPPPDVDSDGVALAADDPRVRPHATLEHRRGCVWVTPGRNPYSGTLDQALYALGLPAEVADEIALKVATGQGVRAVISRRGITVTDDRLTRPPELAGMAFGKTMCFNTRVRFARSHQEIGDVYRARSALGQDYEVLIPHVCGNVSLMLPPPAGRAPADGTATVSEPSPAALLLFAIPLLIPAMRGRR